MTRTKMIALASFLKCQVSELKAGYGHEIEHGNRSYLVCTDREADKVAKESILDSVWAFRPEFLEHYTVNGVDADVIRELQKRCETSNDSLLKLIRNKTQFVSDAIQADGRGHFLSGYDGNENEITCKGTRFYIYRTN